MEVKDGLADIGRERKELNNRSRYFVRILWKR